MTHLKFPRTYDEAFRTTEYACAIERPARPYPRVLWTVMAACAVIAILAGLT